MTGRDRIGGLLAGTLTGIAGGLFGVGGGLVMVPALTGFFGLSQHQAHGTSLAVIGATAITAIAVYGAHANIAWSIALVASIGTLVSARMGARWATRMPALQLRRTFAVFLALVAVRLLWQAPEVVAHPPMGPVMEVAASLVTGLVAGALAGMMGVGGGIIVVPVLTLVFGLSQQAAQGTSLAIMVVTAPTAAIEHSRHGNVVWRLVPMLAIGAAVGAPIASGFAQAIPHAVLVRAFAVFLLATAVHTWVRGGGPRSGGLAGAESGRRLES